MAIYTDDSALEGGWRFDNDYTDESANSNTLTGNNSPTFDGADAQQGSHSIDFERDDSEYASITDASQTGLECLSAFSIGGWFKFETHPSAHVNLIGKLDTPGSLQDGYRLGCRYHDVRFYIDGASYETSGNVVSSTGTWYHIVITHDGTTVRLYIDGSEVTDNDFPVTTSNFPSDVSADFNIGAINSGASYHYDGKADEVFVFSRALSAADVEDIADNGIQDPVSGLYLPQASII